jgi:hypothetical protein
MTALLIVILAWPFVTLALAIFLGKAAKWGLQ